MRRLGSSLNNEPTSNLTVFFISLNLRHNPRSRCHDLHQLLRQLRGDKALILPDLSINVSLDVITKRSAIIIEFLRDREGCPLGIALLPLAAIDVVVGGCVVAQDGAVFSNGQRPKAGIEAEGTEFSVSGCEGLEIGVTHAS